MFVVCGITITIRFFLNNFGCFVKYFDLYTGPFYPLKGHNSVFAVWTKLQEAQLLDFVSMQSREAIQLSSIQTLFKSWEEKKKEENQFTNHMHIRQHRHIRDVV